jgi:hypothetical protein
MNGFSWNSVLHILQKRVETFQSGLVGGGGGGKPPVYQPELLSRTSSET